MPHCCSRRGQPAGIWPGGRRNTEVAASRVSGAASAHYAYNAFHQRTTKTNGGQTTHFQYGPAGQLLAEFDGATGQAVVEYAWLESLPLAVIHSGTSTLGTLLHLRTPQALTDAQGSVVWQAEYTPFGQATVTTNTIPFQLRLPGQYVDQETGLHYNWHRVYDPQTGRYLSSDPIGLAGGLNTYEYGRSNPLRYIDPTGENALLLGLAATAEDVGYWYWDFKEYLKSCEARNESCEADIGDTKPNLDCRRMRFLERLPVKPFPGPRSSI